MPSRGGRTSPAKERELADITRSGEDAERTLVESHLYLVVSIVDEYRQSGVPLLDLIQEGNMGLMKCVSTFDWRQRTDFASHATPWIRQAIASILDK